MVIVNLMGGLGNQMFQYAFGRYLSILFKQQLFLNIEIYDKRKSNRSFDLSIFNLANPLIGNQDEINRILMGREDDVIHITEAFFHFNSENFGALHQYAKSNPKPDEVIFSVFGYWQTEKYFTGISPTIRKDFTFCHTPPPKWQVLKNEITMGTSIMLNVRRGDYLFKLDFHGVIDLDYINAAINYFKAIVPNPSFYIFSDDIPWCKENIPKQEKMFFVDESYYDPKYQYYLQLMISCKHFIISNSSFAWWSAWLSQNPGKIVIAPKKWFTNETLNTIDLFLPGWIKL